MISELNKLLKATDAHKQNISSQKSELSERETTIRDKDARIAALRLKTQELEKFKFVLDYKIKELKKDIKPNAETIGVLKEQTTKMNQEVKHFSRVKTNLELIVTDMKLKMDGLTKENHSLREKIEAQNALKR
jgi:chromosome segregation ATPase